MKAGDILQKRVAELEELLSVEKEVPSHEDVLLFNEIGVFYASFGDKE